jgi:HD-GYP domain-containing protein (c-di-GMP phosphodiesterase class II)
MTKTREQLLAERDALKAMQRQLFRTTVENLATAVAVRDAYTGDHSRRDTAFSLLLGQQLGLSAEDLEVLRYGVPLHDIGKIGIPDAVLRKPGPLTPEEFEVMKTHTTQGVKMLEVAPDLKPALAIVRSHHERWDGRGYPDGLAGEAIPLLARVTAVADSFDAMTFDTPYRSEMAVEEAFAELEKEQGRQYDPGIVAVFLQSPGRVVELMEGFKHS